LQDGIPFAWYSNEIFEAILDMSDFIFSRLLILQDPPALSLGFPWVNITTPSGEVKTQESGWKFWGLEGDAQELFGFQGGQRCWMLLVFDGFSLFLLRCWCLMCFFSGLCWFSIRFNGFPGSMAKWG